MSAVSRERVVRVEAEAGTARSLRWRLIASAVTEPGARAWLEQVKAVDAALVCDAVPGEQGSYTCVFSLEAGGARMPVCSAQAHVHRQAPLTHIDAFDPLGTRLLAATLSETQVLYAVTTLWETLGVPGGRYELC
ncbi:MAG: hypothetical protein U0637_01340 [Phycisphaerales bacterium]